MITSRALRRYDEEVSQVLEHTNDLIVRVSTETVQKAETVLDELREATTNARALLANASESALAVTQAADRWKTLATVALVALVVTLAVDTYKAAR